MSDKLRFRQILLQPDYSTNERDEARITAYRTGLELDGPYTQIRQKRRSGWTTGKALVATFNRWALKRAPRKVLG